MSLHFNRLFYKEKSRLNSYNRAVLHCTNTKRNLRILNHTYYYSLEKMGFRSCWKILFRKWKYSNFRNQSRNTHLPPSHVPKNMSLYLEDSQVYMAH